MMLVAKVVVMVTFVVLDLFAHDGQVEWNVMLVTGDNAQELKLVLVQNLKHGRIFVSSTSIVVTLQAYYKKWFWILRQIGGEI